MSPPTRAKAAPAVPAKPAQPNLAQPEPAAPALAQPATPTPAQSATPTPAQPAPADPQPVSPARAKSGKLRPFKSWNTASQPGIRHIPSTKPECHLCQDHERGHAHPSKNPGPQQAKNRTQPDPPTKAAETGPPAPHHKHTHSVDKKGHLLVYNPEEFEEPAKGIAGVIVKRMGLWAYALFFLIPLIFVSLFFAIIPLGDPTEPSIREQWVFIFISNSAVTLALAFLYNAAFLSCARAEKPFRVSTIPLLAVVLVQIGVMSAILLTNGVFDWLGIVTLAVVYMVLFFSMYLAYADLRKVVVSFFMRFMLLLILFIPILTAFIIAYRAAESSTLQSLVAFVFTFVIFIYRRVMLSRLDPFPLEVSQLLSGFWVQNLGDSVTILAFPQVRSPRVFAAIFISNMLSNVFFLVFVSNLWIYKIRPTLKVYVLNALKCNFPIPPVPEPDESFDPVNRGHDANVGGYRRRQFRFFFFRMLSQAIAMTMYLGISPILRFGLNKEYTPLLIYGAEQYRNSMIYAAANLLFILPVSVFGYWFLNKMHHQTFHEIREIHRHDLVHHTWVGLMTTIITHNLIMTIAIILSHYCIFSSFLGCVLDNDDFIDFANP